MEAAQWSHQAIGVGKETEIISSTRHQPNEKRAKLNYKEQTPNCPRCNSTNTKFCYYNNYSLSQPRYFCKACRRYWTEGGSLRNVPVGGGSRKNKRSSSASSSSSSTATTSLMISSAPQPIDLILPTAQTPLNPTFPFSKSLVQMDQLDLNPGSVFGSGFGFQELLKQPTLKLPWIHHGGFGGDIHHDQVHVCKEGHGVEENGMVKEDQRAPCLFWSGGSGALW